VRILVASKLDSDAVARLDAGHDVVVAAGAPEPKLVELVHDRHAIIFRSGVHLSSDVLASAHELRLLVRAGSGLDNLDLSEVRRRGIELHRIPGPGARAVAEMTFALMLAAARQVVLADRLLRHGRWAKSELVGYNLAGKTLGIVGLGSIGSTVAGLGRAWGMRVLGTVAHATEERRRGLAAEGIELVSLAELLPQADFVTIHVPLDDATRGLIGAGALAQMKPGAFLVNMARGGIVDEHALRQVLLTGHLAGAGVDVHAAEGDGVISPLAELPNVVLTPHIGASTVDAQREIGREVVRIVDGFAATLAPATAAAMSR
jgi:D-3-phosphoglycerate dehydrogenase